MGFYLVIWSNLNYCGRSFDQGPTQSPFGIQRNLHTRRVTAASSAVFTGGWGEWTEYQKCPSIFFILCWYIDHAYVYLYVCNQKLSPTFLWVFKFDVMLESGGMIFKITI